MIYLIPSLFFLAGLLPCQWLARHGRPWPVGVVLTGSGLGALFMIWRGRQLTGWDGIGYAIAAALMLLPLFAGALVGGGIGVYRARKARQNTVHD